MEVKIKIPSNQSEITLGQYQKFLKLIDINQNDNMSENFLALKMLEIFCNVPYMEGLKLSVKDVRTITEKIDHILNTQEPFVQTFSIGKTEFGFIPKLDDMTFGEFVDLESFVGSWEDMHKAMAIFYRPISRRFAERYQIDEYKGQDLAETMREMPLNACMGAMVFFYHLGMDLSLSMVKYLEGEMKQTTPPQGNSQLSGDGITQFTEQLEEMLQGLKISLN